MGDYQKTSMYQIGFCESMLHLLRRCTKLILTTKAAAKEENLFKVIEEEDQQYSHVSKYWMKGCIEPI